MGADEMYFSIHKIIRLSLAPAMILALALPASSAETPTPAPTRTPRPAGGKSLNEVAKEKELKGAEEGKAIVISNENLAEYAEKGSVTAPSGAASGRRPIRSSIGGEVVQQSAATSQDDSKRRYWQGRYQQEVNRVASIRHQIGLLDSEIPGLWRDFYAWDDPMYRDGVIKPRLDELTKRRERLEQELVEAEAQLSQIKDDARRDGGEPGWFRGIPIPTPMPETPTPGIIVY